MKIGSLFSGVAGLDRAVESFFDAEVAWFVEFDAAPSKVLAHHYPDVPNYGDVTTVDWANVEPVDIITGGSPCQDLSGAGRRRGMTEGTRSNLWVQMREAIAILKPRFVVWENVRGAYSATAVSEVESEPGLLGVFGESRPALRALGRVLGDLSELGYDSEWVGIRASDAGAPHGRYRVFLVAYPHSDEPEQRGGLGVLARPQGKGKADRKERERLWDAPGGSGSTAADSLRGGCEDGWGATPGQAATNRGAPAVDSGRGRVSTNWGPFEPAIRRWEATHGFAPKPTEPTGKAGRERLSPAFAEWIMGWPVGWVTDPAIGLTWQEQLKACGNGVVTQQAFLALQTLANRHGVPA